MPPPSRGFASIERGEVQQQETGNPAPMSRPKLDPDDRIDVYRLLIYSGDGFYVKGTLDTPAAAVPPDGTREFGLIKVQSRILDDESVQFLKKQGYIPPELSDE